MYTFGISSSVKHERADDAADDDDAEARARCEPGSSAKRERNVAGDDREARHDDRPEPRVRAFLDRRELVPAASSQRVRVVDQQDAVLRRDADQQDRADQREQVERRCVSTSAPIAPIAATGTEKIMMNGET